MESVKQISKNILYRLSPFTHTYIERKMWRGWFKNGQSLGINLDTYWDFGINYTYLSHENDYLRSRYLFLYFYKLIIFIPLGFKVIQELKKSNDEMCRLYTKERTLNKSIENAKLDSPKEVTKYEELLLKTQVKIEQVKKESANLYKKYRNYKLPEYELRISEEFGIMLHFYKWEKTISFPLKPFTISHETQMKNGEWVKNPDDEDIYTEIHPYKYISKTGEIKETTATISKERYISSYAFFKYIKWRPTWIEETIWIRFKDEVGFGSDKCIGCGSDLLPNETPEQCLRRMEQKNLF